MVLTQTKEAQILKICLKHQLTTTSTTVKVALGNNQFSGASWEGGLSSVMSKKTYCPRIPSPFLGPFLEYILQDILLDLVQTHIPEGPRARHTLGIWWKAGPRNE